MPLFWLGVVVALPEAGPVCAAVVALPCMIGDEVGKLATWSEKLAALDQEARDELAAALHVTPTTLAIAHSVQPSNLTGTISGIFHPIGHSPACLTHCGIYKMTISVLMVRPSVGIKARIVRFGRS